MEREEAGCRRMYGEPFEEQCADAFALESIVDLECHFRGSAGQRQVRRDRDDTAVTTDRSTGEQRDRLARISGISKAAEKFRTRHRGRKEPVPARVRREIAKEPDDL